MKIRPLFFIAALLVASQAFAGSWASRVCTDEPHGEEVRYSWRLKGGLAWIAGLRFPTSGVGALRTVPSADGSTISSELKITPSESKPGYYVYQSQIEKDGAKTLATYHGYSFGSSERHERTLFDYVRRLARIQKETPEEGVSVRFKPIPEQDVRDVLTEIYYLRQHADSIGGAVTSQIFSDGRVYSIVFRPGAVKQMTVGGRTVQARAYRVTAAPGTKARWHGGLTVWLSDDTRHVPVRIELQQTLASLQLDLKSFDSCD